MPKDVQLLSTAGDWLYVSCRVMVMLKTRGGGSTHTQEGGICQLCGNNNVQFIHTLEYLPDIDAGKPDDEVQRVDVGLDCAQILAGADDEYVPVRAENETRRKRKWRLHYRRPGMCITTPEDLVGRGRL